MFPKVEKHRKNLFDYWDKKTGHRALKEDDVLFS